MPNRINDKIRGVKEVRLVGDNVEQGIYSYETAMRIADDLNLDLVEISPNAEPPVCRILDYQKFLYQKKRKEKEIKANSAKVVIKEIRFGPQTDEHDYAIISETEHPSAVQIRSMFFVLIGRPCFILAKVAVLMPVDFASAAQVVRLSSSV